MAVLFCLSLLCADCIFPLRPFYHNACGAVTEDGGASHILIAFLSGGRIESILGYMSYGKGFPVGGQF